MLSKKKKIIGGIVCLGLASFVAGGVTYFATNENSSVAVSSEENLYVDGSGGASPSGGKNQDVDTSQKEDLDVDTSTQTKEKASTQEKSDKKTNADLKNSSVDTSKNKDSDVDTSKKTTDKSDEKTNNQKDKSTTQAKAAEKTTEQKSTKQSSTKQPTTQQPSTTQPATQQPSTRQPSTQQPTTTQPSTTQPATQQPATTQPATTQPATEAPKQDVAECQHEWVTEKVFVETVYHPAETHEVPIYDEGDAIYHMKNVWVCGSCGGEFDTEEEYWNHAANVHYGSYAVQERVDWIEEIPPRLLGYDTITDKPAYYEDVYKEVTKCSKCGKEK